MQQSEREKAVEAVRDIVIDESHIGNPGSCAKP